MGEETDYLAEAIIEHWGPRCSIFDKGCPTCRAWKQYGEIARLKTREKHFIGELRRLAPILADHIEGLAAEIERGLPK